MFTRPWWKHDLAHNMLQAKIPVQCSTFRKNVGASWPPRFLFGRQNKYSSRQKLYLRTIEYNKLTIFYLALTGKECFRLPLNFLSNGFRSRLDYQPVFGKMNPHSSVNLLKHVFKQWNTHLDKQTLGITKKLIWVIKEQNLQNLFCVPCICMFRNEHRWNLIYFAVA